MPRLRTLGKDHNLDNINIYGEGPRPIFKPWMVVALAIAAYSIWKANSK